MYMKERVEEFLKIQGIQFKAPLDLNEILASLDIELEEKQLDDSVSGVLIFNEGKYKIVLNHAEPNVRKRYTIAHEIGHFFLHATNMDVFNSKSEDEFFRTVGNVGDGLKEKEANAFAAELLMPEAQLREKFVLCKGDIFLIADYFKVSETACKYRCKNLNLTD